MSVCCSYLEDNIGALQWAGLVCHELNRDNSSFSIKVEQGNATELGIKLGFVHSNFSVFDEPGKHSGTWAWNLQTGK